MDDCSLDFPHDESERHIISLETHDRIYETLLRLRGNMVVPATFAFPDEQSFQLAARPAEVGARVVHVLLA